MAPPIRSSKKSTSRWRSGAALILALAVIPAVLAQERGPVTVPLASLRQAVDRLGSLDYATRMTAGRTVRRAAPAQAVPVLLQAVNEHADGYIRFRALVLLMGFNDPRTDDAMTEALSSPNDRLREVAYGYFEQHPNPSLTDRLLSALEKEEGE